MTFINYLFRFTFLNFIYEFLYTNIITNVIICHFGCYWSDITASRVLQKIVKFRKYVDIVKVKKVNGKKVKKKAKKVDII